MSFNGLFPVAITLAESPPLKIWQTITDNAKGDDDDDFDNNDADNKNKPTEEELKNQAGTICDLNAYLLMVVAAGVTRVEAMKAAANANKQSEVETPNQGKDRAYTYTANNIDSFLTAMDTWAALRGNGVAQFKFLPPKGAHTFVIERVPRADNDANNANDASRFRVYQAYEGFYRLADFLDVAQDDDLTFYKKNIESHYKKSNRLNSKKDIFVEPYNKKLQTAKEDGAALLAQAKLRFGSGIALTWAEVRDAAIKPLYKMINSYLEPEGYSALTGTLCDKNQWSEKLKVLLCDSVNPNDFQQGYNQLGAKATTDKMTFWMNVAE